MTDAAVIETENAVSVPTLEDIVVSCDNMTAGVRMCLKRISGDGVFLRRMETLVDEIQQIQSDVVDIVNSHTDEYNALVGEVESLQLRCGALQLQVNDLTKELNQAADSAARVIEEERKGHREQCVKFESALKKSAEDNEVLALAVRNQLADIRILNNTIAEYKDMQPDQIKKKNAELKKKNAELTTAKSTLQAEIHKSREDYTVMELELARAETRRTELEADVDDFRRFENQVNGEHLIEKLCFISPKNPGVLFYPYVYKWGLDITERGELIEPKRRNDADLLFIHGMDFHLQIRTTLRIDMSCGLTEFGLAIYPVTREFDGHIPDGMDEAIQEYHMEQLERLSTPLYDRAMWAKEQHISTFDFVPGKLVPGLTAKGFDNLQRLGSTTFGDVESIKGMGQATFDKIRAGCIALLGTYQHESGPIKLTLPIQQRKPPINDRVRDGLNKKRAEIRNRMKERE